MSLTERGNTVEEADMGREEIGRVPLWPNV